VSDYYPKIYLYHLDLKCFIVYF